MRTILNQNLHLNQLTFDLYGKKISGLKQKCVGKERNSTLIHRLNLL